MEKQTIKKDQGIKGFLSKEQMPYLLTAILGIIVIQFNYLVKTMLEVPILEYKFQTSEKKEADGYYLQNIVVTNLSTDKLIKDLQIRLSAKLDDSLKIKNPDTDPILPATIIKEDPQQIREEKFLYYPIYVIQPGLSYKLKYYSNIAERQPSMTFECAEPLKIRKASFLTFIITHQIEINVVIMIIFITIAIVYIQKIVKS
jgi:hypothetical protein